MKISRPEVQALVLADYIASKSDSEEICVNLMWFIPLSNVVEVPGFSEAVEYWKN